MPNTTILVTSRLSNSSLVVWIFEVNVFINILYLIFLILSFTTEPRCLNQHSLQDYSFNKLSFKMSDCNVWELLLNVVTTEQSQCHSITTWHIIAIRTKQEIRGGFCWDFSCLISVEKLFLFWLKTLPGDLN